MLLDSIPSHLFYGGCPVTSGNMAVGDKPHDLPEVALLSEREIEAELKVVGNSDLEL